MLDNGICKHPPYIIGCICYYIIPTHLLSFKPLYWLLVIQLTHNQWSTHSPTHSPLADSTVPSGHSHSQISWFNTWPSGQLFRHTHSQLFSFNVCPGRQLTAHWHSHAVSFNTLSGGHSSTHSHSHLSDTNTWLGGQGWGSQHWHTPTSNKPIVGSSDLEGAAGPRLEGGETVPRLNRGEAVLGVGVQ